MGWILLAYHDQNYCEYFPTVVDVPAGLKRERGCGDRRDHADLPRPRAEHRDANLIPDFVPVLGYLDDLILIPVGIALAIRMIPHDVLVECRARAQATLRNGKPVSRVAGAIIIMIWLVLTAVCVMWAYDAFVAQP